MDSQCYLCPHKGLYILNFNCTDTCIESMEYCKMNQTPPYCTRYNFTTPTPTSTVDYLTKMNYDLSEENKRLREQIERTQKDHAELEKDRNYRNNLAEEFRAEIYSLKKIISNQMETITNQADSYNDLDKKYILEVQQNAELVANQAPRLRKDLDRLYGVNRKLRDLRDDLSSNNTKLKLEIQELNKVIQEMEGQTNKR